MLLYFKAPFPSLTDTMDSIYREYGGQEGSRVGDGAGKEPKLGYTQCMAVLDSVYRAGP